MCQQELASLSFLQSCFCCGRLLSFEAAENRPMGKKERLFCETCLNGEHCFTLARSAGPYEGNLKNAIQSFKYAKKRFLARPLGVLLTGVVQEILAVIRELSWSTGEIAGLVPVPLTYNRHRERGFNQSVLLAHEVAKYLPFSVLPLLKKVRETPSQTGLSRHQRKENLKGAFVLRPFPGDALEFPAGRAVILIDDVLTTGFTADECARVLLDAQVKQVYVVTLASTR